MEMKFSVQESLSKLWVKLEGWLDAIILKLPNIIMAILVMLAFYFIAKGVQRLFKNVLLKRVSQVSIQNIISKMVFIVVMLIGFFMALGVLDLDKVLTSILAGAGVIGLAIGLALQGTLSNTFGGIVLSFMDNIKINDFIEADGTAGFVDEITLRNIVLRRPDNNYVIIPNTKFIEGSFTNYSISARTRIVVKCGVGYESHLQEVEDMIVSVIGKHFEQKGNEEVEFFYTEFDDSSINFMVRFWIDMINSKQEHDARHIAMKLIRSTFREQNINIPFPIRTLDFGKNDLSVEVKNGPKNKGDSK